MWCATNSFEKKMLVMTHRVCGAPLVMRTLMAHLYLVHHFYIAVARHIHGAPLAIALFLVVSIIIPQKWWEPRGI